jgi:hypothetical protein
MELKKQRNRGRRNKNNYKEGEIEEEEDCRKGKEK